MYTVLRNTIGYPEKYGWIKITISKNGDDMFYEFINYDYWSAESDYENYEMSGHGLHSLCQEIAEREGIGQNSYYRYSWDLIDHPPEEYLKELIEKKKKCLESYVSNQKELISIFEKELEDMSVDQV